MSMTLLLSWFFSSRSFSLLHFCHTGSFGVIGFFSPKKWNHHLKTFFFKFAFTHKCDKYAKNVDGDECFSQHCTLLFLNSRFSELKVSAASICCQLFYFGPAFTVIQNDDVFFPQMTVSKMDLDSTETHKVNTQPWWSYRNCMTY